MAIKTKYRIKDSSGKYEVIHFQTSADQVITSDDSQFVTKEEKEIIRQSRIYTHHQLASTNIWEIEHNLGKLPTVSIIDSAGTVVMGDVLYVDENRVKITFSSAFSGKALLN